MSIQHIYRNIEAKELPLLVGVVVFFLLFSLPGMILMTFINLIFSINLGRSDLWFYSFLASIVLFVVILLLNRRRFKSAFLIHGLLSLTVLGTLMFSHYVIHAEFVGNWLKPFINYIP